MCNHPPTRLYAWFAYDGTLCVGCTECGQVLRGAIPPVTLTYVVDPADLGPWADEHDAQRMVELLIQFDYASEGPDPDDPIWHTCAERVFQEKHQPMFPFAYVQGGEWTND